MGPDIKVRQKHHNKRKLQANGPDKYMQKSSAEYQQNENSTARSKDLPSGSYAWDAKMAQHTKIK